MGTGGTSKLRLSQYLRHVGKLMNVKQRYARNIIKGAVLRVTPWGDSPLPLGRCAALHIDHIRLVSAMRASFDLVGLTGLNAMSAASTAMRVDASSPAELTSRVWNGSKLLSSLSL
jgi:hypothetical protein